MTTPKRSGFSFAIKASVRVRATGELGTVEDRFTLGGEPLYTVAVAEVLERETYTATTVTTASYTASEIEDS